MRMPIDHAGQHHRPAAIHDLVVDLGGNVATRGYHPALNAQTASLDPDWIEIDEQRVC